MNGIFLQLDVKIAVNIKIMQKNRETTVIIIKINETTYSHISSSITNPSNKLFSLSLDHPVAFFSVLNQIIIQKYS